MASQLRGSQHYIWSLADVLGQGATGCVYKARHKHTGELYAVKTFNQMSYLRSPNVQVREFDVLRKLDHENIVRLLAIEEESSTHCEILVMELCTGGSLYNLLDDPENAYGIEETEFRRVLLDVALGLKHLRDQGIVHRDIKPGNIMRYINGDDGRSIYKLIDFGAARELQDEEQFISLYGTEEYLFPDMYERAVLKRPTGKLFSATVDLWSLGVTLYHIATGQLPFRPFGGRKNKDTMYHITSEKASGVISGVQLTDGGPIEWSRQLPSTCRLSQGMKKLITSVLAKLLESEQEKMMKFDEFFDEIKNITSKHIIFVFSLSKSSLLHIYISKDERLAQLQELIAEQTDIRTQDQQLLYENHEFEKIVKPLQHVSTYPNTSNQNPIYLFSSAHTLTSMPHTCSIPSLPTFTTEVSLDSDFLLAKNGCAIIHFVRRLIIDLLLKQQLIIKAAKMYLLVLSRDIEHIKDMVVEFSVRVEEVGKRLQLLSESGCALLSLVTGVIKARSNEIDIKQRIDDLSNIFQWSPISNQKENFTKLHLDVERMKQGIELLSGQVSAEVLSWLDTCGCKDSQSCILKTDVVVNALKQTVSDFARDRTLKKLSFNEEQIHKFDKHKMKTNCTKAVNLVQDDCYPNTKKVYERFQSWYSLVWEVQMKLQHLKNEVIKVSDWQGLLTDSLNQTQDSRQMKLKEFLEELGISVDSAEWKIERSVSMEPRNFEITVQKRKNNELRELLSTLKIKVSSNQAITLDAKHALEQNEKLIRNLQHIHLHARHIEPAPNCTYEEPSTLTDAND